MLEQAHAGGLTPEDALLWVLFPETMRGRWLDRERVAA